jgi:hypothetical protein
VNVAPTINMTRMLDHMWGELDRACGQLIEISRTRARQLVSD